MNNTIKTKTRFAPSPTGPLHLGGARTALYNYLYAFNTGSEFVLRMENTNRELCREEYEEEIAKGLSWLGITYNDIFHQDLRTDFYEDIVEELLKIGYAYKCYCTKERLDELKQQQIKNKLPPKYDRKCHLNSDINNDKINKDQPYVIRFDLDNPFYRNKKDFTFNDITYKNISIPKAQLDDFILRRNDGSFTYNFACACDDVLMQITHVIRGNEHIINTIKQILIINILKTIGFIRNYISYNDINIEYTHLPMLVDQFGKKLSKRDGSTNILEYKEQGYLPQAVVNYIGRLGHKYGDEILNKDAMIYQFDLNKISKSPTIFDLDKLTWTNKQHMKLMTEDLLKIYTTKLKEVGIDTISYKSLNNYNYDIKSCILQVLNLYKTRGDTVNEIVDKTINFYREFETDYNIDEDIVPYIKEIMNELQELININKEINKKDYTISFSEYKIDNIKKIITKYKDEDKNKYRKICQAMQYILLNTNQTPPLWDILFILQERGIDRINNYINKN